MAVRTAQFLSVGNVQSYRENGASRMVQAVEQSGGFLSLLVDPISTLQNWLGLRRQRVQSRGPRKEPPSFGL
ncbi:MAG: hypothetical protein Alpg2KO_06200 [Alphaproteobacteria bacterium]